MAKLYFRYAAMNAGKSTALLQVAHNYAERGMKVMKNWLLALSSAVARAIETVPRRCGRGLNLRCKFCWCGGSGGGGRGWAVDLYQPGEARRT